MKQTRNAFFFAHKHADTCVPNKLLNFHSIDWESLPFKCTLKLYKLNYQRTEFLLSTKSLNYFSNTERTSVYLAILLKKNIKKLISKLGVYSEYLLKLLGENSAKLSDYYHYSLKHETSSNLDLEVLQKWAKKEWFSFLSLCFFSLNVCLLAKCTPCVDELI